MLKKVFLVSFFSLVFTVKSLSHDFWLHASSYSVNMGKLGAITTLYTGNGHLFPVDEKFEAEAYFKIINPDSKEQILESAPLATKLILNKDGNYIVSGKTKPTFWTNYFDNKGTRVWKSGSKEGISNIITSRQYNKFAKSIISVGEAKDLNFSKTVGDVLEIIPLENPNNLKANDYLNVKILFKNEPLVYAKIYGTYSGFSNSGDYSYSTTTNQDGIAKIKLTHSGYWLLKSENLEVAPKELQNICNELYYVATLTFQVK